MNKNKAFDLLDFGKKRIGDILICDEHSLNSNTISFETQLAIVTHYLQNKGTIYETTYKKDALKIIHIWSNTLK